MICLEIFYEMMIRKGDSGIHMVLHAVGECGYGMMLLKSEGGIVVSGRLKWKTEK